MLIGRSTILNSEKERVLAAKYLLFEQAAIMWYCGRHHLDKWMGEVNEQPCYFFPRGCAFHDWFVCVFWVRISNNSKNKTVHCKYAYSLTNAKRLPTIIKHFALMLVAASDQAQARERESSNNPKTVRNHMLEKYQLHTHPKSGT